MLEQENGTFQHLLEHVQARQTLASFYDVIAPMFRKRCISWQDDRVFQMLTVLLSTRGGTIDGVREAQFGFLGESGVAGARIPSDQTIKRHLGDFGRQHLGTAADAEIDYDPLVMDAAFDEGFRDVFLAAIHLARLKSRDFIVTLDGSSKPFYGKSWTYRVGAERRDDELSFAGYNATGAFRGKKDGSGGVPLYRGTVNKHDYFQMTAHLYDTAESFPLAIRRGLTHLKSVEDFVKVLDALPIKPLKILGDKEFANYAKLHPLRKWCDANDVVMLFAMPKDAAVAKLCIDGWHSGAAQRLPWAEDVVFWTVQRHSWRDHRTMQNNLLTLYFHTDPRKDQTEPAEGALRLPNQLFAICFLTNIEVNEDLALWLWKQYSLRWACENLWKRHASYCGGSFSHGMFLRDFTFNAGMLLLGVYGLWRLNERRRAHLSGQNPQLSHTRFFGAIRGQATAALWQPRMVLVVKGR